MARKRKRADRPWPWPVGLTGFHLRAKVASPADDHLAHPEPSRRRHSTTSSGHPGMSNKSTGIVLAAAILVVVVLIALMTNAWTGFGDAGISAAGWFALVLGVLATLAIGIGLMALVFISNRLGYDDRSHHGR